MSTATKSAKVTSAQVRAASDEELKALAKSGAITLDELIAETQRRAKQGGPKETKISASEFKGNAMLNFEGNWKPYSMSVAKAARVLIYREKVETAMAEHGVTVDDYR